MDFCSWLMARGLSLREWFKKERGADSGQFIYPMDNESSWLLQCLSHVYDAVNAANNIANTQRFY